MLELKYEPYELLHKKVKDFVFEEHDVEELEKNMINIMRLNRGIGLAANQIGLDARVFVMGTDKVEGFCEPQIIINPYITGYSEEIKSDKEGCLSFPRVFLDVKRPIWIEAVYQDIKGNTIESKIDGYLAKVFQHECDHLDGICFTDRVSKLKLDIALRKIIKGNRRTK